MVIALWESEQDGYGKDLKVFASLETLCGYLERSLEEAIVSRRPERQNAQRESARMAVAEARETLGRGDEWEWNGETDHGGEFEGLRLLAKRCEVRE